MNSKITVTIGIPALNEGKNVRMLLDSLIKQQTKGFKVIKFIIVSDGSTDDTVIQARSINDARLKIIEHPKRQGLAAAQNTIISQTNSDILVLLNADILINDKFFITRIIQPIIDKIADFTSAKITELPPTNFFEQILSVSMKYKTVLFHTWNSGDNIYTCHGPARAFSQESYSQLIFPQSEGEDLYSYLYSESKGFRYKYVQNTEIFYRLPNKLRDHFRQSIRFVSSREALICKMSNDLNPEKYQIPLTVICKTIFKSLPILLRFPIHTLLYFLILSFIKICHVFRFYPSETFQATSSKKLIIT